MSKPIIAHYLIRVGEIGLKGNNRHLFEGRLKENIKRRLKGIESRVRGERGRFFLEVYSGDPRLAEEVLSTTFGIVGFAPVTVVPKELDAIAAEAEELLKRAAAASTSGEVSFKIDAKRTDKSFPLNSYEIAVDLGDRLRKAVPGAWVDVKHPEVPIHVEIRRNACIWGPQTPGPGGLPVGCAGKGILLLSGGIDSPVAGYMMSKRGLKLEALYFHAYPYTSNEAKEKVVELARRLAPWNGGVNLMIIPFTAPQLAIKEKAPKEVVTLAMRAGMMRIAHMAALERHACALVTGEALSQVASQTAMSMRFTGSVTDFPVFRPLIGMDKEEIIRIAERIETFETSILPYEDCCTIFSPKHPLVSPNFEKIRRIWAKIDLEELLVEAWNRRERVFCPPFADGSEEDDSSILNSF
jgi:thiamine biosynthesis protein ThiI